HPEAGAIINWIEGPECVGVFVNQPLDDVNMICRQTGIDLVQLHGNESPEYTALVEKPVIKVIHIEPSATEAELEESIEPYLPHIEYLMFDTKIGDQWGGTGETFEWSLIKDISKGKPFFLSGGINEHNIRKACKEVKPYAVDLSSSLESKPGVKDFDKVESFMEEMREIWEEQEMGEL
ncbi:MAG: phosphoribosylanthranilate isomerase, partial [Candidatus Halalkalibacterium sp. M3_1C_030]